MISDISVLHRRSEIGQIDPVNRPERRTGLRMERTVVG